VPSYDRVGDGADADGFGEAVGDVGRGSRGREERGGFGPGPGGDCGGISEGLDVWWYAAGGGEVVELLRRRECGCGGL
jgi:hypothetical protein